METDIKSFRVRVTLRNAKEVEGLIDSDRDAVDDALEAWLDDVNHHYMVKLRLLDDKGVSFIEMGNIVAVEFLN